MNGYSPISVYRGLWRFNGTSWERATWRPGHYVQTALPEYLDTYNARAEYPELSQHLGAPYWAGLWYWDGSAWRKRREWSSWAADTGAPGESVEEISQRTREKYALIALIIAGAFIYDASRGKL